MCCISGDKYAMTTYSKFQPLIDLQELIEELGIYFLFFDRAGYGDSDPNPKRSVKSEAFDIQELADKLHIGSKFFVIGVSIGAYPIWGCLKYIPNRHDAFFNHKLRSFTPFFWDCSSCFSSTICSNICRLAGASLVVPFVNYWWPCFPSQLAKEGLKTLPARDQWVFRIAYHAPWLFYWWMTQKWFPSLSIMSGNMSIFSQPDLEMLKKFSEIPSVGQVGNISSLALLVYHIIYMLHLDIVNYFLFSSVQQPNFCTLHSMHELLGTI